MTTEQRQSAIASLQNARTLIVNAICRTPYAEDGKKAGLQQAREIITEEIEKILRTWD